MVATNGRSARQQQAERYSIGAVENALTLLGAIADRDVLGLGDAAEIAGVSKSTAYRLLATLEVAGLAERLPELGYRAGVEAIRWASRLLAGLDVRTVALPSLRQLRQETGETVNLALLRETSLVYVEILESPAAFRMADVPGSTVPIHATALGKAVAVHLEPQLLATILGPEPYERFTARTPTTWQAFNASLGPTRATGYGVDMEEVSVGRGLRRRSGPRRWPGGRGHERVCSARPHDRRPDRGGRPASRGGRGRGVAAAGASSR